MQNNPVNHQRRGHAKGNDISQGIEFAAEGTVVASKSCQPSVEQIKEARGQNQPNGEMKFIGCKIRGMASNLTAQVRNIADVTTAVAKGDLSRKITVDVRGEILELKNTINTMVDQLNSFASEVTRVAREVGSEGKLGGQARVEGVSGTWKDLTDSVNFMLPEMDGYETMRQIRARHGFKELPIIALTAKAMRGDREKCIEAGASDYIAKPVDTEKLVSMLRMVLQFVGFLGGWNSPGGLSPAWSATLGAFISTWTTFVPSFLFILIGAPYIERLRGNHLLNATLSAVTAAIVGVILNLAVWFAAAVLFPGRNAVNVFAVSVCAFCLIGMLRWKWEIIPVVVGAGIAGLIYDVIF